LVKEEGGEKEEGKVIFLCGKGESLKRGLTNSLEESGREKRSLTGVEGGDWGRESLHVISPSRG